MLTPLPLCGQIILKAVGRELFSRWLLLMLCGLRRWFAEAVAGVCRLLVCYGVMASVLGGGVGLGTAGCLLGGIDVKFLQCQTLSKVVKKPKAMNQSFLNSIFPLELGKVTVMKRDVCQAPVHSQATHPSTTSILKCNMFQHAPGTRQLGGKWAGHSCNDTSPLLHPQAAL